MRVGAGVGGQGVHLVNDFVAAGYGLLTLQPHECARAPQSSASAALPSPTRPDHSSTGPGACRLF
jgi:glucokinase